MHQLTINDIRPKIVRLPGRELAMLDRDLARLYGTEAKNLNYSVRRNSDWFDEEYRFKLTQKEAKVIKLNLGLHAGGHYPYAYTHEGCNAAAFILNSRQAKMHRKLIIAVFTEIEKNNNTSAQILPDIKSIIEDAVRWRIGQLYQRSIITPARFKKLHKYENLGLSNYEIAKLLDCSEATIRRFRKKHRAIIQSMCCLHLPVPESLLEGMGNGI